MQYAEQENPSSDGPTAQVSSVRVLIVEDSRRLRDSLSLGLRRLGFAVDVAADGEEGLWQAESNAYDVIVLDLMLPKMDGLTDLRRLR